MTHGRASQRVPGLHSHCLRRLGVLLLAAALGAPQLLVAALPAGRVVGWGGGFFLTGDNRNPFPSVSNVVAVSATSKVYGVGAYALALLQDGTVIGKGSPAFVGEGIPPAANVPQALNDVVGISAASFDAALAVRRDGTVVAWGSTNAQGTLLTTLPSGLTNVVQVICTDNSAFALRADGTVVGWGDRIATNVPPGLSNVSKIWTDGSGALVLLSNGTVAAWTLPGYLSPNILDIPLGLSNVVDIAGSYSSTGFAVKNDGSLVQWGRPTPNLPTGLTNVAHLHTGGDGIAAAISRNGQILGLSGSAAPPAGTTNVIALVMKDIYYFVALTIDPQITAIERTNQQTAIRFPTFSGQQYAVQSSPNLNPGSWTNLSTVPGTGYEARVTDTNAPGPARFYRLRQQ